MSNNDVVVAIGTRPEAIKVANLVGLLGERGRVVHTGQHYDVTMWEEVVAELPAVQVHHRVEVGGRSRGEQIGEATSLITQYLTQHPARVMVVQGDTNSTLAGALAASSLGIPVVHVEAGLRSHDRGMPEEINRILVDAVADLACAPTSANAEQLLREGLAADRISVTGNTLGDALHELLPPPPHQKSRRQQLGVPEHFALSTVHRAGNVDDSATLEALFLALGELAKQLPVVLPLHPHTAKQLTNSGLDRLLDPLLVLPPIRPTDFLALEAQAQLILSDSGGVQEEACLLRRPLLVLRDSTERPELVSGGWCRLLEHQEPTSFVRQALADLPQWFATLQGLRQPYPNTSASAAIVAEIDRRWPSG